MACARNPTRAAPKPSTCDGRRQAPEPYSTHPLRWAPPGARASPVRTRPRPHGKLPPMRWRFPLLSAILLSTTPMPRTPSAAPLPRPPRSQRRAPQAPSRRSRPRSWSPELVAKHGEAQRRAHRARARPGRGAVAQAGRRPGRPSPASTSSPTRKQLDETFARFEANFEQLDGHLLEIGRELRRPSDLDVGPMLPVDPLFAAYDPGAHVIEDLFAQQAGVRRAAQLPADHAGGAAGAGQAAGAAAQWAEVRLAGRFGRRVPGRGPAGDRRRRRRRRAVHRRIQHLDAPPARREGRARCSPRACG